MMWWKVIFSSMQGNRLSCKIWKILLFLLTLAVLFGLTDCKSLRSTDDEPVFHVFHKLKSEVAEFPNPEPNVKCTLKDKIFNLIIDVRKYKCGQSEKILCMDSVSFGRVFLCIPKSTLCQEGIGWTVVSVDDEDVVIRESKCSEGFYQKWKSQCYNACMTRHITTISRPFKLYAKGDNKGPAIVTCKAADGYYNPNNITFVKYDINLSSSFCTNVNIKNPCSDGRMPLSNGTCLDVCSKDYIEYVTDSKCKALRDREKERDLDAKDQSSTFQNVDKNKQLTTEMNNGHTVNNDGNSKEENDRSENNLEVGLKMSGFKIVVMIFGLLIMILVVCVPILKACLGGKKKGVMETHNLKAVQTHEEELRKLDDNTYTQPILGSLNEQMKSVGALIRNGVVQGTVFRVGTKYVMTAFHVIKPIVWDEVSNTIDEEDLGDIFVNFNAAAGDCPRVRPYIRKIKYVNVELDVVILELTTLSGVPNKMLLFRGDRHIVIEKVTVIGFGNPSNQMEKYFDPNCTVIQRNSIEIQNAIQYYETEKDNFRTSILTNPEAIEDGYRGCDDNENILFHGFMEHGASGAPILVCNDARYVYVVGVLTHGIPGFFYNLPKRMQKDFPSEHLFHKGCRMQCIYQDLMQANEQLAKDIFCV